MTIINYIILFLSNIILILSEKTVHHYQIATDFSIFEKIYGVSKQNLNYLKTSLNSSITIINSILLVKSGGQIEKILNPNVCDEEISISNMQLLNGIKADFLLFINIDINQNEFMTNKICTYTHKSLRPIIGVIKINDEKYNFLKHSIDNLTYNFLNQLTRLLGFNYDTFKYFTNLRKNNTVFLFEDQISFRDSYILNQLILKGEEENIFVEIEKIEDEIYLKDNLPFNDYMIFNEYKKSNNFENNFLISPYTLSILNSLNWYYVKLPYLDFDFFTYTYNLHSYIIEDNYLIEVNYCFGDYFMSKYKFGNKCELSDREYENEIAVGKFPEIKDVEFQELLLIKPLNNICKNPQKTLFFKYYSDYNFPQEIKTPTNLLKIKEKEFMVVSLENFSASKYSPLCLRRNLEISNIIRTRNVNEANIIWYNPAHKKSHPSIMYPYEKYNHFLNHSQITRKDLLYKNYKIMENKFPNDYNFMSTTYRSPAENQLIQKVFKDYKPTKDNLWLIKPQGSTRGKGIQFLDSNSVIRDNQIITKYISNPHLIEGKKYDLRIYLFVTGHRPLKIYIYEEGLARRSTEEYNLEIENLNNLYIHLTNVAVNKKNPKFNGEFEKEKEENIWSLSKLKEYYEKEGINYDEIFEKIKDLAIKSVLTMTNTEIETENLKKKYILNNGNLFELYGMDILIDENMKPWLLEINLSPSLGAIGYYEEKLKSKLFADMFNILGFKIFSHADYEPLEYGIHYKDKIEENVEETICEFERQTGSFIRVFPRKENIDYYKKFLQYNIAEENLLLWKKLKNIDI